MSLCSSEMVGLVLCSYHQENTAIQSIDVRVEEADAKFTL